VSRTIDRQLVEAESGLLRGAARRELPPLALLALLLVMIGWHRFAFDSWLTRYDLYTFFTPWYAYLGERLRDFDVPGWNPHLFSGTLLAGHPISGWMYWPVMLPFAVLPALTAFKVLVGIQLAVAGFSTYALARRLDMGPWPALVAAAAYVTGPLLEWNTYCCLHFSEFATWLPLAMLGADWALGARDRLTRWTAWFVAGFAISQILAGWVGEGWIYALLLVGGFTLYRALTLDTVLTLSPIPRSPTPLHPEAEPKPTDPPAKPSRAARPLVQRTRRFARGCFAAAQDDGVVGRVVVAAITGIAVFGLGGLLGAAGVWPRLALNPETNLAGGDYGRLGDETLNYPPWNFDFLLAQIAGFDASYYVRATGYGGAIIVCALLAPVLARGRHAVPFFAVVTVVAYVLTLDTTPVHHLFYLIPQYEALHVHDPWRVVAAAGIGPPLLAGASLEALRTPTRSPPWIRAVLPVPFLLLIVVLLTGETVASVISLPVIFAALLATLLIVVVISGIGRVAWRVRLAWFVPVLLFTLVVAQPAGLELTGAWLHWPDDPRWETRWRPDPEREAALRREIRNTDPGGAGEFLQAELARSGPFRYAGYIGYGYPNAGRAGFSPMDRRFDPNIQAVLANGHPMLLGLYDIQGYDPIQLARDTHFFASLNGAEQDYHTAFLMPTGVNSPLLDLLDVRFLLLDATLPPNRDDVIALTQGRHEVFRNDFVVIYERDRLLPHAWIVHDVQPVAPGEAAPVIALGQVDPWQTGLVDGPLPTVEPAADPAAEQADITRYEADTVTVTASLTSPGLLIVSEIVADGWQASVDGEEVPILTVHDVLRGVPLTAGDHEITFRYAPPSLRFGLMVSAGAHLALLTVLALVGWRTALAFRRRRRA
jgi:hypothetical protein